MKDKHRTTAFYMEMLVMVAVVTGVVMVLSGVFATAKEQSRMAGQLTAAVHLAENAAEIVAGTEDHGEMVGLLGDGESAACHLETQKLLARYNSSMEPDPNGPYCMEITWEEQDGLVNYDIRVSWQEGEPVYRLKTSVFYG